jgi:hypothetical protein
MRSFTPLYPNQANPEFAHAQTLLTRAAVSAQAVFHLRTVEEVDPFDAVLVSTSLDAFRDVVDKDGLVPDTALLLKYGGFPIDRLAASALRASAVSPVFDLPHRMELVRTWARAFSSGPTPYIPTERYAMHSARAILDDAINEGIIQAREQNRAHEVTNELYKLPLGRMALMSTPRAIFVTARTNVNRRKGTSNPYQAA